MLMLLVEDIVLVAQRVVEIPHRAVWMQLPPRAGAHAAFAALEREKQGIEARREFADGVACDGGVGGREGVEIGELVGVSLGGVREITSVGSNGARQPNVKGEGEGEGEEGEEGEGEEGEEGEGEEGEEGEEEGIPSYHTTPLDSCTTPYTQHHSPPPLPPPSPSCACSPARCPGRKTHCLRRDSRPRNRYSRVRSCGCCWCCCHMAIAMQPPVTGIGSPSKSSRSGMPASVKSVGTMSVWVVGTWLTPALATPGPRMKKGMFICSRLPRCRSFCWGGRRCWPMWKPLSVV